MRHTFSGLAALAVLASAQPAAADTISDWIEFANKINNPLAPTPGAGARQDTPRATTRVALAMFEALNAIDRRYETYLGVPVADVTASPDAAAITAAYRVLHDHFPGQRTSLDDNYAIAMAAVPDDKRREAGRLVGEAAAKAALAAGGIDPAVPQPPYRPRTSPGEWVATDLPSIEPVMYAFHPWAIPGAEALRPPPPPALDSARWARDYDEVKRLGARASTQRTPNQTLMARYRQAFDLAPTMRRIADTPGRTLLQNARMFARYQMAMDDAIMAMAEAKIHYNYWRPITAIRNGDLDGNDGTAIDPAWIPLLSTPNFPEYPCGHCTVAAAIAEVMSAEVGPSPAGGVKVGSLIYASSVLHALPGWKEWAQQVSDSRIYGGVHFRFSNEAGEEIGRQAARAVVAKTMKPLAKAGPKARAGQTP